MTNRFLMSDHLKNACPIGIIALLVQAWSEPAYAFQACSTEPVMYGLGTSFPSLIAMLLSVGLAPISAFLYVKRPTALSTHALSAAMLGVWFMTYLYGHKLSLGTCTASFSRYDASNDWIVTYGIATMLLSLVVQQFVFRVLPSGATRAASQGVLAVLLITGLLVTASTTRHTKWRCGSSCMGG